MGRKPRAAAGGPESGGASVRLSVVLPADTHRRLRALALVRGATAQDLVAALVATAVAGVRLPSVAGDAEKSESAA